MYVYNIIIIIYLHEYHIIADHTIKSCTDRLTCGDSYVYR